MSKPKLKRRSGRYAVVGAIIAFLIIISLAVYGLHYGAVQLGNWIQQNMH